MNDFFVLPLIQELNDGSNQKVQFFPETVIKGVIGLPEKISKYDKLLDQINENSQIATKEDLENLTKDINTLINKKIIEIFPNFKSRKFRPNEDVNYFLEPGFFILNYGTKGVINLPNIKNSDSQSGILIVLKIDPDNLIQIFLQGIGVSNLFMRNRSGSPAIWTKWNSMNGVEV